MNTAVKLHPIASVFPSMTDEEFKHLKADIDEHGQRESIVYWNQMLIDGRHRLRACQELGIEPIEVELDADHDPIAFALSHNLHRRHLTTSQRGMVAAKLARLKHGEVGNGRKVDPSNDGSTVSQAAKSLNVGTKTVERAKQVQEHGSESVKQAVEQGEIPVSTAAKLVRNVPDKKEQDTIVDQGPAAVKAVAGRVLKKPPKKRSRQEIEQERQERIKEEEDFQFSITPTLKGSLYKLLQEIKEWDIALSGFAPELWKDEEGIDLAVTGINKAFHQLKANLSAKLYG